jgi:hypothetical protein
MKRSKLKLNPITVQQLTPPRLLDPKELRQAAGGSLEECGSRRVTCPWPD